MTDAPDRRSLDLARLRRLFAEAEEQPAGDRESFVRVAAGDDRALADEVLALLRAGSNTEGVARSLRGSLAADRPDRIGPYTIVDTLGEGGMGTVYLAEQTTPVKRRVALKLIKLGMDSKAVVARFEQERQALALMDHDGIAKVYDCGTSERGQPFFVMELVQGIPLTSFCDEHRVPLRGRIELMQQVCAAVQHAHQKGVVHRDLSPRNVLVALRDGAPQAKIIDFGLAKSLGPSLGDTSALTEAGQVLGTLAYMAPEQADPSNPDVDTRADVHALGAMLYELLTGELPFPFAELRRMGMLEVQRVLREQEPPKPSSKLLVPKQQLETLAAARCVSATALRKALQQDLDWVVLKAIDRDRARRYATPEAMAADLQRFLDCEPLAAGPPSAVHRVRKMVRRHRSRFAVAAAVVGMGLVGATAYLAEFARAETKNQQFHQLGALFTLDQLLLEEPFLYPPWPHQVEPMRRWLAAVGDLSAAKSMAAAQLQDLRVSTSPIDDAERHRRLNFDSRFVHRKNLESEVAALQSAMAVRTGSVAGGESAANDELRSLSDRELAEFARARTSSTHASARIWGEELPGLAAARELTRRVATAEGEVSGCKAQQLLAWALFANGHDEEALEAAKTSVAMAASRSCHKSHEYSRRELEEAIREAPARLLRRQRELAALQIEMERRVTTFPSQSRDLAILHDACCRLLGQAEILENRRVAIEQRLALALRIGEASLHHPRAPMTWDAVRSAVANNPLYSGRHIDLSDENVMGLVPIGENPVTRLWEFYDLHSAWDGRQSPDQIPIPRHADDGSTELAEDTGIIFVLLPGGTVRLGSQSSDDAAPLFAAERGSIEEICVAHLDPFFIARHEVTQAQFLRLTGENRSFHEAGWTPEGATAPITSAHPVEMVSWEEANTCLRQQGMLLPTEAQWEYACRAGSTTQWNWSQDCSRVAEHANLGLNPQTLRHYDSWATTWPCGTGQPNAFGLFDMHGNVTEWCLDEFSYSTELAPGDGLRAHPDGSGDRVLRGGGCDSPADHARAAARDSEPSGYFNADTGFRAARRIRPR